MDRSGKAISRSFVTFSWVLTLYLLAVILWGAYVRATGSGAGCGNHWPLCNGQVIPPAPEVETIIEFVHRLSSGIGFLLVILLMVWAFRSYPRGSVVRVFASLTMVFMVSEALLGAGLVLFGLVADDSSFTRAWVMAFHLINTFLLLGCLSLTGWCAWRRSVPRFGNQSPLGWFLLAGLVGLIVLGASGGVTALGDTLFPSESLADALGEDFSPTAHFLIQLRVYHPLLAILTGVLVISVAVFSVRKKPDPDTRTLAFLTGFLYLSQLGVGLFNLLLLAPVWLQLIHLLMADLTWMGFILFGAAALTGDRGSV